VLDIADTASDEGTPLDTRRYFQVAEPGTGWGGTGITDPLSILGPFDPKCKAGHDALRCRPPASMPPITNSTRRYDPRETDASRAEVFGRAHSENCEPALCTVLFMGGAGGSLRAGVTDNPVRFDASVKDALTRVTSGGAPVYVWPGGGITFMVDVTRLPAARSVMGRPRHWSRRSNSRCGYRIMPRSAGIWTPRPLASLNAGELRQVAHRARQRIAVMTRQPQVGYLGDGRRLHLQDGPIVIQWACAEHVRAAYAAAIVRFTRLLDELSASALLRSAADLRPNCDGVVARRMHAAVAPFARNSSSRDGGVAGSVAEEIWLRLLRAAPLKRAYVNNARHRAASDRARDVTVGLLDRPDSLA